MFSNWFNWGETILAFFLTQLNLLFVQTFPFCYVLFYVCVFVSSSKETLNVSRIRALLTYLRLPSSENMLGKCIPVTAIPSWAQTPAPRVTLWDNK